MSEFTSMGKIKTYDKLFALKVTRDEQFRDLLRKLGEGREVKVTIQYEDPRQDWIDKWYSKAGIAEGYEEVSFAFVKDGTVCIDREQGDVFTVAAPRKGDKYDRKTGIAVAFAKFSGVKIPEYI